MSDPDTYYRRTMADHSTRPALSGAAECDVAIIGGGLAGRCVDAQAQALAAQRAVRPGKGCGLAITGAGQVGKQGVALGGVECVQPARIHPGGGRWPHGLQQPACAGQGRCLARRGVGLGADPGLQRGRWQMAEMFAAPRNPTLAVQVVACGQAVGKGGVHGSGLHGVRCCGGRG